MTMTSVTPAEAQRMIQDGAKLIDIRDPDEHAREHIPGADNVPLAEIDRLQAGNCPVVFHCRSGARTGANAARLVAATGAPCYRSEEHTSELQSLMRTAYAVFCLKKKK